MDRILFYMPEFGHGGAQRHMSVIANSFAQYGYYVTVASFFDNSELCYKLDSKIKYKYITDCKSYNKQINKNLFYKIKKFIIKFKYRRNKTRQKYMMRRLKFDYSDGELFREFLRKGQYDIIIPFTTRSSLQLSLAARKMNNKICIPEIAYPEKIYKDEITDLFKRSTYNSADFHIFQTKEQFEFYKNNGYVFKGKSCVIHNPIKDNLPDPSGRERKNIIVNFCRLDPVKNLKLLISAFKIFSGEYPDYKLYIYGEGPQHDEIIRLIDELGLNGKVLIKPFEKNIHEIILDYKMFVSSSDSEGISNSIIEAMGIGLPVISTNADGGGAKAVIRDGENGLIVPKGNADEMYKAMKRIADDSDFASKLSENGVKIKETLSAQNIGKQWIDAIESVL